MDNLKTDLERVRAAVGGPMPMKTMRAYLAASDDAFRFLRTHGEALAGMVRDAERYAWLRSRIDSTELINEEAAVTAIRMVGTIGGRPADNDYNNEFDAAIDEAMQESRDE